MAEASQPLPQAVPASRVLSPEAAASLRGLIFFALLALVWISTEPFRESGVDATTSGNIVNQIVYSLAAAVVLAALALSGPQPLRAYLRPIYFMMLAWMLVSVFVSINPDGSARAFAFTLIVLLIALVGLTLPVDERQFALAVGSAALVTVLVSYAGLVLFPATAMHSAADLLEPEHAGSWRGLFDHKNVAGPMMAFFAMIGLYVAAVRSRPLGWALFVLAVVFLSFTKAKTSMALFPLAILVAAMATRIRTPLLRGLLCLGPLALLLTITVGSVLLTPIREILDAISPGQTFTGRTDIWDFAFDKLAYRPWIGFGFEGFWGSDMVRFAEKGEGDSGIAHGMVHGHNGYVDVVMNMGLPGLFFVAVVLLFLPLVDYERSRRFAGNADLARLYLGIWLFAIYDACLESFFFRRSDPVWFTLILAVFGLRLVSIWRVAR